MTAFEIRPMRAGELEAVVRTWRRSREDAQPWLEARVAHSHADDLRFFGGTVMRENEVWLAVRDGAVLGLLAIAVPLVAHLYVDPAVQGRGVGSALLAKARALSPRGLRLFTHQRNARARAFYEGHGFRVVRLGVSPPPESEPDVEYAWEPTVPRAPRGDTVQTP